MILAHTLKNRRVPGRGDAHRPAVGTLLGGAVVTETILRVARRRPARRPSRIFLRDYPSCRRASSCSRSVRGGSNLLVDSSTASSTRGIRVSRRLGWPLGAAAPPGLVILAVLAAVLAPWISPASPTAGDLAGGSDHRRGRGGSVVRLSRIRPARPRDVLSRLLWGARISLSIALGGDRSRRAVGSAIGLVTGYYRGPGSTRRYQAHRRPARFPFVLLATRSSRSRVPASPC